MVSAASTMPAQVTTLPTGTQLPTSTNNLTASGQMLNENDFLQLLTAQLEHQDPLDPTTADEFASELAEFSTATGVQNLEQDFSGQQAIGLVGQNVAVSGNTLVLPQSGGTTGAFSLPSAASNVVVTIANASGNTVASLNLGAMAAGTQSFSWSGAGSGGATQPAGNYKFAVTATAANGAPVTVTPYAVVPVTGVGLSGQNGPTLDLGGGMAPVPLSSVQQVF
jgi:flagellar basal-body rod modification protein FlgD